MKRLPLLICLLLPAIASAGEPNITETETGITVEYTGVPAEKDQGAGMEKSPAIEPIDIKGSVESLTARIEQLRKEIDEIAMRSGSESTDELLKKNALLNEKWRQIEVYSAEIRRLSGSAQPPPTQQEKRREMKQEIKSFKELRGSPTSQPN